MNIVGSEDNINESEFPTMEQVEMGIKLLSNEKWDLYDESISIDDYINKIHARLTEYFKITINLVYPNNDDITLPFKFFRVRPLKEYKNINLIREHSYPPINSCNKPQRLNLPNYPLFYSSDNPMTALMEVIRNNGILTNESYCISSWKLRDSNGIKIIPFLYDDLPKGNPYREFGQISLKKTEEIFKLKLNADKISAIKMMLMFYSKIFKKDEFYSISSFLGHTHFYANHNFRADLFLYPSIQTQSQSTNIAIHPNCVDDKMFLKYLYVVKVKEIDFVKSATINIQHFGEVKDGIIYWKSLNSKEDSIKEIIDADFGIPIEYNIISR
jgi:hypothetical protein